MVGRSMGFWCVGGGAYGRAVREPKAVVCTLGTLNADCGKAFSLLRFFVAEGPRNEVPPRTVANSDKKIRSHITRANVRSSNPASTPTTDHQPRAQTPDRVRTQITRVSSTSPAPGRPRPPNISPAPKPLPDS